MERLVEPLHRMTGQILAWAQRLRTVLAPTPARQLLRSLSGVGWVLAVVLGCAIGTIARFPSAAPRVASARTTPDGPARGGRIHVGQLRGDSIRSLRWACIEAASNPCRTRQSRPHRHVSHRSARGQQRKGHATAVGAVARRLAEATHWILSKREPYRDPAEGPASSTEGPARSAHERQTLGI